MNHKNGNQKDRLITARTSPAQGPDMDGIEMAVTRIGEIETALSLLMGSLSDEISHVEDSGGAAWLAQNRLPAYETLLWMLVHEIRDAHKTAVGCLG